MVDQHAYIDKILAKFGMEDCKEYSTPLAPGTILYPTEEPLDFPMREWNGSLLFCRLTRADLLFACLQFSRIAHAPDEKAMDQMMRAFGRRTPPSIASRDSFTAPSKRRYSATSIRQR